VKKARQAGIAEQEIETAIARAEAAEL